MTGDNVLHTPGSQPSVRVVADGTGTVAGRGDVVELVGEGRDGIPEVALASGSGFEIGHLVDDADDYDSEATYAAGDRIGESAVYLRHYVDWFDAAGAPAVGTDHVVFAAGGGVRAYDPVDTGADDQPEDIVGPVFRTVARGEYRAGKVAVVRRK